MKGWLGTPDTSLEIIPLALRVYSLQALDTVKQAYFLLEGPLPLLTLRCSEGPWAEGKSARRDVDFLDLHGLPGFAS